MGKENEEVWLLIHVYVIVFFIHFVKQRNMVSVVGIRQVPGALWVRHSMLLSANKWQ